MLIEAYCKKCSCDRWYMNNLEIPKECPTCKETNVWWNTDEFLEGETVQAVEFEEGDEDE